MIRCLTALVLLAGLCAPLAGFARQTDKEAREERLAGMRRIAERFKVRMAQSGQPAELPLQETPLLRFNDPARDFHDASLWAWGSEGRPVCLLAMEQYGGQWWFELISLTSTKFSAEAGNLKWTPQTPGLEMQAVPDALRPASDAVRRLPQMRELLNRLEAYEVDRLGKRFELRLMAKPLHRYSDPEHELQDGAIFAFSYGTNPELLAIVEAVGEKAESAEWKIGFARCGAAEPHVLLNEKEIFRLPYAGQTTANDPYWNFPFKFPAADK
jgi:hypothetical protein